MQNKVYPDYLYLIREVLKTILFCLVVFIISILIRVYFIRTIAVSGDSMEKSISDKDIVVINEIKNPNKYDRFDIIVFKPYQNDNPNTENEKEDESLYIKRIIGLPGETITVTREGTIQIIDTNGNYKEIDNSEYGSSAILSGINWNLKDDNTFETITLSDDEFFVLGDNRSVSKDSRSESVGAVKFKSILGRYIFKFRPLF